MDILFANWRCGRGDPGGLLGRKMRIPAHGRRPHQVHGGRRAHTRGHPQGVVQGRRQQRRRYSTNRHGQQPSWPTPRFRPTSSTTSPRSRRERRRRSQVHRRSRTSIPGRAEAGSLPLHPAPSRGVPGGRAAEVRARRARQPCASSTAGWDGRWAAGRPPPPSSTSGRPTPASGSRSEMRAIHLLFLIPLGFLALSGSEKKPSPRIHAARFSSGRWPRSFTCAWVFVNAHELTDAGKACIPSRSPRSSSHRAGGRRARSLTGAPSASGSSVTTLLFMCTSCCRRGCPASCARRGRTPTRD